MGVFELKFEDMLRRAVIARSTDIHIKTGLPPVVRINDELRLLARDNPPLSADEIRNICAEIIPERLRTDFVNGREIDMAYSLSGVGRFRLNIFRHRGQTGLVARFIPFEVRTLLELGLPESLRRIALTTRGLVLVTGSAGSGKSTTLAAMLSEWNSQRSGHVVTIEDPIEYLLADRKSIVTQREVGLDTPSFDAGLRHAMRQDPDVIMIGEMRDRETIQTAMSAAETGHLVLSTLHTKDAAETVNRIIGVFEPESQQQIRVQFAASLAAIVSQRLLPSLGEDGKAKGLVVATEILVNSPRVRDCIQQPGKGAELREAIEQGAEQYGMHSFDQDLMRLLKQKRVTRETALRFASNPADFELRLRGISSSDAAKWGGEGERPAGLDGPTLELDRVRRK